MANVNKGNDFVTVSVIFFWWVNVFNDTVEPPAGLRMTEAPPTQKVLQ